MSLWRRFQLLDPLREDSMETLELLQKPSVLLIAGIRIVKVHVFPRVDSAGIGILGIVPTQLSAHLPFDIGLFGLEKVVKLAREFSPADA